MDGRAIQAGSLNTSRGSRPFVPIEAGSLIQAGYVHSAILTVTTSDVVGDVMLIP
jgi:hypothetical protein